MKETMKELTKKIPISSTYEEKMGNMLDSMLTPAKTFQRKEKLASNQVPQEEKDVFLNF